MHFLLKGLFELVQAITYKWLLAIISIIKRMIAIIKVFCKIHKLSHEDKHATNSSCGPIDQPAFHRPDPLIYSQPYLLNLGLAVTWDNPDIIVLKDGVIVSEDNLLPNTEYEIDATIWNNSYDAPVGAMKVDFHFLSFGAGTTTTYIGSRVINVGVKGSALHPAHARVKWVTPTAGHYCLQVRFDCPDDLVPGNNIGQNNINVRSPQSPAVYAFSLRNPFRRQDQFRFEIDTYTLPDRTECGKKMDTKQTKDQKWEAVKQMHNKADHPVPMGWTVNIDPEHVQLQPNQALDIEVKIEPPLNFTGQQTFNINAIARNGRYAGGVTLIVNKP